MRTISFILLLSLLTLISDLPASGQTPARAPLSANQVSVILKTRALGSAGAISVVNEAGVNFELDPELESALIKDGGSKQLIDAIRNKRKTVSILVSCNVGCFVRMNNGATPQPIGDRAWKATDVLPPSLEVEVSADAFVTQTRTIEDLTAGTSRKEIFKLTPSEPVVKPPATGKLNVTCEPVNCLVFVDDNEAGQTMDKQLDLALLPGKHKIRAQETGYESAEQVLEVTLDKPAVAALVMRVDTWARTTAQEILEQVVGSLGGPGWSATTSRFEGKGHMTLKGDETKDWTADFVESAVLPDKIRWDFNITATKWKVLLNDQVSSSGDNRYIGTPFARALETGIRPFAKFRLQTVLSLFDSKSGFAVSKKRSGIDEYILVAESKDERYTLRTGNDYRPTRLTFEALTGIKTSVEIDYGKYTAVKGALFLPYLMTIGYGDRPNQFLQFEYDRINVDIVLKDSVFK